MVLVQKWPFFQLFFLGNIGQENVFYDILERKNAFLRYKKKRSNSPKIEIFPNRKHMVLVQKFPVQSPIFNPIIDIFAKALTHCFVQKWPFSDFFLGNKPGKCLLLYSRTKKRVSRL